jgi:hypothetical protein
MTNPIKFSVFLLVAGLVAFASCEKPTPAPDPESQAILFADPANCFMVNEPGFYTFKTVKGKTTESVGDVAVAVVLWETFGTDTQPQVGDVISEAYYKDGQVYFKTPNVLKDGNALIAVKDAGNKILWSWHIWVCNGWDATATAQTYYNKHLGGTSFGAVMDRNLGATSIVPGDAETIGLMYQWGRKDPFLGNDGVSDHKAAASTLIWPDPVLKTKETGTIEFAIAHPTVIIYPGQYATESINGDWYYMAEDHVTDNTRWQEKKDLYDPCPAGWTLPRAHVSENDGLWYNTVLEDFFTMDYDASSKGLDFTKVFGDAKSIWYPYTGHYAWEDGRLHPIAPVVIWSSDISDDEFGWIFYVNINGEVNLATVIPYMEGSRAQAFPTRCVAVK